MREIKDQVNCFSKGTKISVNLIKPTSDQWVGFFIKKSEVKNGRSI
jgi:hypothetical protein